MTENQRKNQKSHKKWSFAHRRVLRILVCLIILAIIVFLGVCLSKYIIKLDRDIRNGGIAGPSNTLIR